MIRESLVPPELDERLKEWARYFRDRHRYNRVQSIEGRFNPYSPGSWDSGWGEPEAPQSVLPEIKLPRVLLTHTAVHELPRLHRWAITYAYCYANLERWQVLKFIKKYTGQRISWKSYLEVVDIGRVRIWSRIRVA